MFNVIVLVQEYQIVLILLHIQLRYMFQLSVDVKLNVGVLLVVLVIDQFIMIGAVLSIIYFCCHVVIFHALSCIHAYIVCSHSVDRIGLVVVPQEQFAENAVFE